MGRRFKRRRGEYKSNDEWDQGAEDEERWCERRFVAFYKRQLVGRVVRDEAEWEAMMATLRKPLPVTLRVTGDPGLRARLESELSDLVGRANAKLEAEPMTLARLAWVERGWQVGEARATIRKSAAHEELHQWLVTHERAGSITRQEAVSMVPPLFLDARPGDRVFDACAAPGSKTTQLIEAIDGALLEGRSGLEEASELLIANDENLSRAHTLVHQLKRLGSPSWLVSHCDARAFPTLYKEIRAGVRKRRTENKILFDKILCDVPCSSDGTLRKTPSVLKRWRCSHGTALHVLQARIAKRAAELLAPGGRLVYSTCSMNPVEDEAVVAEILRSDPTLSVVDASDRFPDVKRRAGLDSWAVFDDVERHNDDDDDDAVPLDELCPAARKRASLFPPTDADDPDRAIRDQLAKCMRFVPHDDDTGGFFVAVLERPHHQDLDLDEGAAAVDDTPAPPEKNIEEEEEEVEQVVVRMPPRQPNGKRPFPEDLPYVPFSSVADLDSLVDFYGLEGFPTDLIVARACDDPESKNSKRGLVVSRPVRDIVLRARQLKLRIVHAGVVLFSRNSDKSNAAAGFRIVQDGIHILLPFMRKRKIECGAADFGIFLQGGIVSFDRLTPPLRDQLHPLDIGSVVCVLDIPNLPTKDPPAIVTWRSPGPFVHVYCAKNDLAVLASRFASLVPPDPQPSISLGSRVLVEPPPPPPLPSAGPS
ncbi:hypothetical protein CTAYLR_004798 [Chrysophaeum taylorii]|uniref:SAM-dependent MTase RsmB/NOP-type domain-containing protein n=1 Tax=Chrysophaeum taylorii TaxID=2483200 RepID=A0AAD7UNJ8_9STRA|nr:hypothetical protein CTAYLR_004798 [Chrysophaeum taylorii]